MATVRNGLDFILGLDGDTIGGTTSATETTSVNVSPTVRRDKIREPRHMPGRRSHTLSFDGMHLENGEEVQGHGSQLLVKVADALTALEELTQITLSLSMEMNEYPGMDDAFWTRVNPGARDVDLSCNMNYVDPAQSDAWGALDAAVRASDRLEAQLAFGTAQYDLTWVIEEYSREMPTETATGSVSGKVHGLPQRTKAGTPDPGIDALLSSFFSTPSPALTAVMKVQDETGTLVTGATMQTAQVYPSSLEVTISEDGPIEVSGELTTDGGPEAAEQAAPA